MYIKYKGFAVLRYIERVIFSMKIGGLKIKRRYSIAQIVVDIVSVLVLLLIFYTVFVCANDIEQIKEINETGDKLDFLQWQPLIIWCIVGVFVWIASILALVLPRKMPKKHTITENFIPKYCNIIDTCISCLRFVMLLAVFEICYLHMQAIMMQETGLSVQLVLDVVIAALIIWFTAVRIDSLSQVASSESEEKKEHKIIEN